jgi:hypothetical protein
MYLHRLGIPSYNQLSHYVIQKDKEQKKMN